MKVDRATGAPESGGLRTVRLASVSRWGLVKKGRAPFPASTTRPSPSMASAAARLVPPAASSRPHTVTMVWAIARGAVAPSAKLTSASHATRARSLLGRGKDHSSFTAPDRRLLVVQVDEDAAGPARM